MAKLRICLFIVLAFILSVSLLNIRPVFAETATLIIDGGNGSIKVDDEGGANTNNELTWDGRIHTLSTYLAAYDSVTEDIDNAISGDYKGILNDQRNNTWQHNQSGIQAYPAPDDMPACVGYVAADDGDDPSVPSSFEGANTGLTVEQFVYAGANAPFAIHEYRMINNTATTKNIKVAHFNDFEVYNSDDDMGYDAANRLVWERSDGVPNYIVGSALLGRSVSNWFLHDCCVLPYGLYADQKKFFTGDSAFNGYFEPNLVDLEVNIAANIGILAPGQSAIVAFATAAGKGDTSALALADLQETIAAANACYALINPEQASLEEDTQSGVGTCFIATAAYGSYFEPHVKVLRDFRDRFLLTNRPGNAFVKFYYSTSPPIADYIAKHESLRMAARWALTPLIYGIKYPGIAVITLAGLVIIPVIRRKKAKRAGKDL